jgi:hypothetical protein
MGHSTIWDIIGSTFFAGIVFLLTFSLNSQEGEYRSAYNANYLLQQNLTALVVIMENDFKRVGYGNPLLINETTCIIKAFDTCFTFRGDIDNNGMIDTVSYWVGNKGGPAADYPTDPYYNPSIRYLYRTLNGVDQKLNLGVTDLRFRYYRNDAVANEAPLTQPVDPGVVGMMDLALQLQTPVRTKIVQEYMNDTSQYQIFWRQVRLTSKNLRYR